MQAYSNFLEEMISRQEWSADDKFWFSPGDSEMLNSVWSFFCDNQTTYHLEDGPRNIWIRREDGSPINFKAKPCYSLHTMDLIGITLLFDRSQTSQEDIFSTLVYHAKLGELTKPLA